jgi:hypothetical protein
MHQIIGSIQKKIGLWGVCLLLSYCPVGIAATEVETTNKLKQLVTDGKYAEGLALANETMFDYGGEPTFDYFTGMAAMKLGEYQQAVFAFERAVIVKPLWQQARFNLAKSYYYIENFVASKNELEKLYKETEDLVLKEVISQFLVQVDKVMLNKKRKIKQVFGLTAGYDSNINSGSTLDKLIGPLNQQPIFLDENGKETSDQMMSMSYMLNYQTPLNQQSLLIGDFALFHTNYANDESAQFETTVAQFSGKFQDVWNENTYQVGFFYRPLLLDNKSYRDQYGLISNFVHPYSAALSLSAEFGYGITDYKDIKSLNSSDAYITFSGQYRSGSFRHLLSANLSSVNARNDTDDYNSYKSVLLNYQISYVINAKQLLNFGYQWQQYDYEDEHPFFLKVRDDNVGKVSLGWSYMMQDWLMIQANYRHQAKDSNLFIDNNESIYSYDRDEFSVGAVITF